MAGPQGTGCWEIVAVRVPHAALLFLVKAQFFGGNVPCWEGTKWLPEGARYDAVTEGEVRTSSRPATRGAWKPDWGQGNSAGGGVDDVPLTAVLSLQGSWMRRSPLKLI